MPKDTFLNLPPDKRARIAEAAIEEFAEKGYTGASISQIVARAKIAKGSFYQYFDGKIVLFRWLLMDVTARRKLEALKDLQPPSGVVSGDFWEQLATLTMGGLRFGLANPRLSRIAAVLWHPSADPELQALTAEFQRLARRNWTMLLQQGRAMGHVRADLDLDLATEFLLAQLMQGLDLAIQRKVGMDMIEFCSHPEREHELPPRDQRMLVDQIMDLLRRALGTAQADPARQRNIDLSAFEGLPSEDD